MTRRTEWVVWGVSFVVAVSTIVGMRTGVRVQSMAPSSPTSPASVMMFDGEHFDSLTQHIVDHDPFRVDHHPAAVAFGEQAPSAAPAVVTPSPLRALALRGVVGGPPWQAVLAGVPNRNGNVVVREGDTLAGLRVVRTRRESVVLQGRDTVLTLTLTHTWQ